MAPRKPVKKLFKIGEVAEYSGLSRQTVNYYTILGILREAGRTKAGHRLYDEAVFDDIEKLRELKTTKTLREIADILRNQSRQEKSPDGKDS
jgi:MerR family copper efflux transcriptional regulator